jgi:hypothetical protein
MKKVWYLANENNWRMYYSDTDSYHHGFKDVDKLGEAYENAYGKPLYGSGLGQFQSDFELNNVPEGTEIYSDVLIVIGKKNYFDHIVGYHEGKLVGSKNHMRCKGITGPGLDYHAQQKENSPDNIDKKDGVELFYTEMTKDIEQRILLNPPGKSLFDHRREGVYTKKPCYRTLCNSEV